MGQLLVFTLNWSMVMLAMYLVYRLLLAGDRQYGYNRLVLLSIYLCSPLITLLFGWLSFSEGSTNGGVGGDYFLAAMVAGEVDGAETNSELPVWPIVLILVWLMGVVSVAISTALDWLKIRKVLRSCDITRYDGYDVALSDDETLAPFSLKRIVVMSRKDYVEAGDMILAHELCHISSRHWIDLLVGRVAIVLAWFNPVVWLMQDELKSVHEFQADYAVIRSGVDARSYQLLLIKKAVGRSFPAIANSLNHSNLKKRITMMMKPKSSQGRWWRSLALAPAVAVALFVTNLSPVQAAMTTLGNASLAISESHGEVSENPSKGKIGNVTSVKISSDSVTINGVNLSDLSGSSVNVVNKDSLEYFVNGEKVTHSAVKDLNPSDISAMNVMTTGDKKTIYITTKSGDGSNVVLPQFPGGEEALNDFIARNVRYPKFEGSPDRAVVVLSFTVNAAGEVTNPEVLKGAEQPFIDEAMRVVKLLPRFSPATENGVPTSCRYALPFSFVKDK